MFTAGNYTRTLHTEEDPFNVRSRAFLDDDASALSADDRLTADQIKAAYNLALAADQTHQATITNGKTSDLFIVEHPEFKDTKANAQLMNHELNRMFGDRGYSLPEFEEAYESLRASNFLAIDKNEDEKRRKEAAKQQAAEVRRQSQPLTEEEMYSMPLDDLRRLDAVENQKRMQRIGETGGW